MSVNTEKPARKKRWDAGTIALTERDITVLTWIGDQYTIRLDQLQVLLGQHKGIEGALNPGATGKLVDRWKEAGWVEVGCLIGGDPYWVWLTRKGMHQLSLPYTYKNMENSLDHLRRLYAINEVRLHYEKSDAQWVSERQFLREVVRESGRKILHRPGAERHAADGAIIAIEVKLFKKKEVDWAENLMELVRGERYLQIRTEHGVHKARTMSQGERSQYAEIWYFAEASVCKQVQQACAHLVEQGDLALPEAERIFVRQYPLTQTEGCMV